MQGQLFTQDFLLHGIQDSPPWQDLAPSELAAFEAALGVTFAGVPAGANINEAQTEQLVIERVLRALGWAEDYLPQANLSGRRREDVPDILLFANGSAKAAAICEPTDDRRYRHGIALLEAKRWSRPLDRGDPDEPADPGAPSSQMLRYLSRADVVSDRKVKWGVLTNGAVWRLYWQDARSRAEEFFEIDVAGLFGPPEGATGIDEPASAHSLKVFLLLLGRRAFLAQPWDPSGRTFHGFALGEARAYEEKVSHDLGDRIFREIFPTLAEALAAGDLQSAKEETGYGSRTRHRYTRAYLEEVRESALILLYRLLFLFYAEDRRLLPVGDPRYRAYSVRRLREQVRDDLDAGKTMSSKLDNLYRELKGAFQLIDEGDDAVGMPAYNGGLFERARAPLLERTKVPDKVMAPIIDKLSRRTEELLRGWINYRDLSVAHLGSIYERLLEYGLVHEVQAADSYYEKPEIDRIVARPASFARKTSGSYYTHDHLVRLVLRESIGVLAAERIAAFEALIEGWAKKHSLNPAQWDQLDRTDPASTLLDLKVCDPAMGSGHFLVALVDDLADRVLEAVTLAQERIAAQRWAAHLAERGQPWQSPVVARLAHIRRTIRAQATAHGWNVTDEQLDDRHIVRRMVLKKCIFGVDKNLMAVELAKTALWLHTFTVGAPLTFLDHHLKHGDSLHGEELDAVRGSLHALGMIFQTGELERLAVAAKSLEQVADLTDVDIAEANLSKQLSEQADAKVAPLHALLDFWRAMRWLVPGWPRAASARRARFGDDELRLALAELLSPRRDLVATLAAGQLKGRGVAIEAANALLVRVRALASREAFFHWRTAFPTAFGGRAPGFDAVIGNPPWDRIKLQEVEWFSEREPTVAAQPRAADRKAMIAALRDKNAPLAGEYAEAIERAEANARVLAKSGDYPLLGGGDVNLYSMFVERAQSIVAAGGIVALLTPSGIAADKGASAFWKSIATTGRLGALFDFENRKVFFPDVHASFKFSTLVFGGTQRRFAVTRCAFFLHALDELDSPERTLTLSSEDFALVNPNTGAAPIFRTQRDADITMRMYREHPVLVRHGTRGEARVWPVEYATMFHMTNDSHRFETERDLRRKGFVPATGGRWRNGEKEALPLYVGRMIHQYDHRHASVTVSEGKLHNAAIGALLDRAAKADADRAPEPQYWVQAHEIPASLRRDWLIGFRDIARSTDIRTVIACFVPGGAAGNTLALLPMTGPDRTAVACLLLANLNSLVLDYLARQKTQSTHLNWYIVEQLPFIDSGRFRQRLPEKFLATMRSAGLMNGQHADATVADFIVPQVLALSYTAHDLAPFARDLGYIDPAGAVLPPLLWDDEERRARKAALDALFMHLYGVGRDDAAYILDTFPIVREQDEAEFGRYRTKDDILELMRHFEAARGPSLRSG